MATDDERREVAERLRGISRDVKFWGGVDPLHYVKKGVFNDVDRHGPNETIDRLADLIDPTCEAHRDVLFYPATGLTEEHEEAVFMCGKCGEIASYDEDYDPETDLPTYCMRCGSRIIGIGEPWDE